MTSCMFTLAISLCYILYKITVLIEVNMGDTRESNVGRMPELTDFGMVYSAVGSTLVLDLVMKDSLTGYIDNPQPFPDMQLSIGADMARELAAELLKCADAIEVGMSHPALKFVD